MTAGVRKWVNRAALALLLLVALLAVGAGTLLRSTAGARWLLAQADTRLAGEVNFAGLEGDLWNGLDVQQLSFIDSGLRVEATGLTVAIDWRAVSLKTLPLQYLRADSLRYRSLAPQPTETKPLEVNVPPFPLRLVIEEGEIDQVSVTDEGALSNVEGLRWSAFLMSGQNLGARQISASAAGFSATGHSLEIQLAGSVPVSLDLGWNSTDGAWSGTGPIRGTLQTLNFEQTVSGPYPGTLRGSAQWLGNTEPVFDAVFQWEEWSFETVTLRQGNVRLRGVPDSYESEYSATVQAATGLEASVAGTAFGHLDGLDTFTARLQGEAGSAILDGSLAWLPEFTATAQVQLEGFDPGLLHPALSGQLAGSAQVGIDSTATLTLSSASFEGTINDTMIRASGDLEYGGETLQCTGCRVVAGDNRISLDGQAGPGSIELNIDILAPSLERLWAGLGGSMTASGRLGGTPDLPLFTGTADAQDLSFGDWSARRASIDSRTGSVHELDLDFTVDGLIWQQRELGKLDGTALGRPERLTVQLEWIITDAFSATATADLEQNDAGFSGVLKQADISEPRSGTWSLNAPATFSLADGSARIGALDWSGPDGQLHVARFSAADGKAEVSAGLEKLPLGLLNPFLPAGYALSGRGGGSVDLVFDSGAWTGLLEWRQEDTLLEVEQLDQDISGIHFPLVALSADLAAGGADISASVSVDPGVTGKVKLRLDSFSEAANIRGDIEVHGGDWDWVPAVVPQVDRIKGAISADFQVSGPLRSPALTGQLSWTEGSLVVPALNVPVTDINLVIEGEPGAAATISGSALAGGGQMKLNGQASNLLRAGRTAELYLAGDTAELLDWPDYHVWASPDLTIRLESGNWIINGILRVPRAEISVRDTNEEAITPSPDVTVIGEEPVAEESSGYSGEAQLILGDAVHLQAYGLDTRLEGDLTVRQARNRALRAEGRVTLADGVFEAYGQKLVIEDGTLTFTGPLDNPLVDVRAIRKVDTFSDEVTAGIHLTGRALALNAVVYSEPAMAEAEALSYLVLGQPLSQATSSEGSQLSSAAIGLGLRQANRITGQIGRNVGLDQLGLTSDTGEGTALVAGKQINDRLYARYAYGVFSRLGTLLLRYRLSQRLTLEAGTGEAQTLDLLYTVEKK